VSPPIPKNLRQYSNSPQQSAYSYEPPGYNRKFSVSASRCTADPSSIGQNAIALGLGFRLQPNLRIAAELGDFSIDRYDRITLSSEYS